MGAENRASGRNNTVMFAGALVLEAIVLTLLWLVGHYFTQ